MILLKKIAQTYRAVLPEYAPHCLVRLGLKHRNLGKIPAVYSLVE